MLVDGMIIQDGADMIRYLDRKLVENASNNLVTTAIVLSSDVRKELTKACQKVMGQTFTKEETIIRFRNILLVEDGLTSERLEVVAGPSAVAPVEGEPFLRPRL